MKGRKPKPLELRVLHGKAGEMARETTPRPRRVLPRCPDFLTGEAQQCWKRLARELYDAGLLTTVDRDALAMYCTAYARWRLAETKLAETGLVGKTSNDNLIQNPYLAVANRALDQMGKLAAEFGMTPSSRSRVKAEISAAKAQRATERPRVTRSDDEDAADPRKVLNG